jgi:hypothetical protein
MSKVIMFSRTFPAYHPQAGMPTFFVEKLWTSIAFNIDNFYDHALTKETHNFKLYPFDSKHHTIRKGNRFKVGDKFSPRVWGNDINPKSGKRGPYHSKQITIAPDVDVKKTYKFEITDQGSIFIEGKHYPYFGEVCKNDGLSGEDFLDWFQIEYDSCNNKPFDCQIICWSDSINY